MNIDIFITVFRFSALDIFAEVIFVVVDLFLLTGPLVTDCLRHISQKLPVSMTILPSVRVSSMLLAKEFVCLLCLDYQCYNMTCTYHFWLATSIDQIGVHEQNISDILLCFTNPAPHIVNI